MCILVTLCDRKREQVDLNVTFYAYHCHLLCCEMTHVICMQVYDIFHVFIYYLICFTLFTKGPNYPSSTHQIP